jgi:hypothetical protein
MFTQVNSATVFEQKTVGDLFGARAGSNSLSSHTWILTDWEIWSSPKKKKKKENQDNHKN